MRFTDVDGKSSQMTPEIWATSRARIAELEAAIEAALRHAKGNGMSEWPVFAALRKAINK
jgi:hypothetical protein